MKNFREIKECRVCNSKKLAPILSLGNLFISDFVKKQPSDDKKVPLELVLCENCLLLQLKHTANQDIMYANYWYLSGLNESMVRALKEITDSVKNLVPLESGDLVLDIGCNDGTLLRSYNIDGLKLVGMDPAKNLKQYSEKGTTKIITDYFNYKTFAKEFPKQKAKIITSIAMFYDLDKPNDFVSDIKQTLATDGTWVIQMNYLPSMLENNSLDNICHEHLEYYSLRSLEFLLAKHELKVFDVELNNVNGGSYRIFVKHANNNSLKENTEHIQKLVDWENKLELEKKESYFAFAKRGEKIKQQIIDFVKSENAKGKKTFVYGASTKGNTLLQYWLLGEKELPFAVERNPDKYGLRTIGSNIPIISEKEALEKKPDYYLVMPYHFIDVFLQREKEFLERGGKFVVPAPEFKIIGKD
jgi:SAM-dependent methyltransferase